MSQNVHDDQYLITFVCVAKFGCKIRVVTGKLSQGKRCSLMHHCQVCVGQKGSGSKQLRLSSLEMILNGS